jgi:hypothetical protein
MQKITRHSGADHADNMRNGFALPDETDCREHDSRQTNTDEPYLSERNRVDHRETPELPEDCSRYLSEHQRPHQHERSRHADQIGTCDRSFVNHDKAQRSAHEYVGAGRNPACRHEAQEAERLKRISDLDHCVTGLQAARLTHVPNAPPHAANI